MAAAKYRAESRRSFGTGCWGCVQVDGGLRGCLAVGNEAKGEGGGKGKKGGGTGKEIGKSLRT